MNDVFISYAREDSGFVRTLFNALSEQDRKAWVDWKNIPPSVDWKKEIFAAIESAFVFVFVISPDSIASNPRTTPGPVPKRPPDRCLKV